MHCCMDSNHLAPRHLATVLSVSSINICSSNFSPSIWAVAFYSRFYSNSLEFDATSGKYSLPEIRMFSSPFACLNEKVYKMNKKDVELPTQHRIFSQVDVGTGIKEQEFSLCAARINAHPVFHSHVASHRCPPSRHDFFPSYLFCSSFSFSLCWTWHENKEINVGEKDVKVGWRWALRLIWRGWKEWRGKRGKEERGEATICAG